MALIKVRLLDGRESPVTLDVDAVEVGVAGELWLLDATDCVLRVLAPGTWVHAWYAPAEDVAGGS